MGTWGVGLLESDEAMRALTALVHDTPVPHDDARAAAVGVGLRLYLRPVTVERQAQHLAEAARKAIAADPDSSGDWRATLQAFADDPQQFVVWGPVSRHAANVVGGVLLGPFHPELLLDEALQDRLAALADRVRKDCASKTHDLTDFSAAAAGLAVLYLLSEAGWPVPPGLAASCAHALSDADLHTHEERAFWDDYVRNCTRAIEGLAQRETPPTTHRSHGPQD